MLDNWAKLINSLSGRRGEVALSVCYEYIKSEKATDLRKNIWRAAMNNKTQKELAKQLNVSQPTISRSATSLDDTLCKLVWYALHVIDLYEECGE